MSSRRFRSLLSSSLTCVRDDTSYLLENESYRKDLERELADALVLILLLWNELEVEPSVGVTQKLRANARKYPADVARGRSEATRQVIGLRTQKVTEDGISEFRKHP